MEEVKEKTIEQIQEEQRAKIFKKNFNELKKKYGENFAKLCRSSFPVLMEEENTLIDILANSFPPSKFLYEDLVAQEKIDDFITTILYKYKQLNQPEETVNTNKTPKEIFEELGYDFYKCETNKDVLSFKKYYAKGEDLCTFRDPQRIEEFDIFFVVKKDIEKYRRENYTLRDENNPNKPTPQREDNYSTSVMSIQFGKNNGKFYIISRYNHTVTNPNSVFRCDLEMIAPGLTKSFANIYGVEAIPENATLYLDGYELVGDKYYKYNVRDYTTLFCPNNTIINTRTGEITQHDKSTIEIIDNFLVDKKNCTIKPCPGAKGNDSFLDTVQNLTKIEVENIENSTNRLFKLTQEDGNIIELVVNNKNQIVSYSNEKIKEVGDYFLCDCMAVETCNLPNVEKVGNSFLKRSESLTNINMPKVKSFGHWCLENAGHLKEINFPLLETVGSNFAIHNHEITTIDLPNIVSVGDNFFWFNSKITKISMPKIKHMGYSVFNSVVNVKELNFPELETMGSYCFEGNIEHKVLVLPKLKTMGSYCFQNSHKLVTLIIPNVGTLNESCFENCEKIKYVDLTNVNIINDFVLTETTKKTKIFAPNLMILSIDAFNDETIKSRRFKAPAEVKEKYIQQTEAVEEETMTD